jgi:hypothetical protein
MIALRKPMHPQQVKARSPRYDGRSIEAGRIKTLAASFRAALGNTTDPITSTAIMRAAELVMLAEVYRAKAIKGELISVEDVVRIEKLAESAVRRLGIKARAPIEATPSLADIVAEINGDA